MNKKKTSPKTSSKASEVLRSKTATAKEKSVAASDLAQARGKKGPGTRSTGPKKEKDGK